MNPSRSFIPHHAATGLAVFRVLLWIALLMVAAGGRAADFATNFSSVNLAVPDGSSAGVSDTRFVNALPGPIADLQVTLTLSGTGGGGFNGDLYVTILHETGYAVLLNRPGRREDSALGYGDNGLANVTFDDAAIRGDVHAYRLTLGGDHTTPLVGPLTGLWAPDGRRTDPDSVLLTSSRTALLDSFGGLDPSGAWTLYVADLASGGTFQLDHWGLEIALVPEPATLPVVAVLFLLATAKLNRRRQ